MASVHKQYYMICSITRQSLITVGYTNSLWFELLIIMCSYKSSFSMHVLLDHSLKGLRCLYVSHDYHNLPQPSLMLVQMCPHRTIVNLTQPASTQYDVDSVCVSL